MNVHSLKKVKELMMTNNQNADNNTTTLGSIIPIKLGFVYSYLVKTDDSYILIDTGYSRKRKDLVLELETKGIQSRNLKLIILTHQDFDHTGNAAYLRNKYDTKIAMHNEDAEAVERGDMLWNRKGRNVVTRVVFKFLLVILRMRKFQKFKPDILLSDGENLSSFGLDATVLHLPGHSKGSIGILTAKGELLCGDLFMNHKKPDKSSLVDIKDDLNASIEKLRHFEIGTVYPGHGEPFLIEEFFLSTC